MRYELAHIQSRATNGQMVNFVVFNAQPRNNTAAERDRLLNALMSAAMQAGLKVEAGGLVYEEYGDLKVWGDNFTRSYVANNGVPSMNKTLDVS